MKKIIQNIKENYRLVLGMLVIGLLLGWLFFHQSSNNETTTVQATEAHTHEGKATIWTCSMHPQIRQDKPGKCPICAMDLIPLSNLQSDQEDINPDEIQMTESAAKLSDIQTLKVKRGIPNKQIYLQGKVQADERRISELTARFGGRIEKLYISFTGENVQKGQKLATIYSPELVTAQKELLEAIGYKELRPSLYRAAKSKLKLWDLTDEQISAIEERAEPQLYFDILAPISGTVTKRQVAVGDYVKVGMALFEVVDLSHVWIMFDAYESDIPWIKTNDKVGISISSIPGKEFSSKITFIDPVLNEKTRTTVVRAELTNEQGNLRPGMFAKGKFESVLILGCAGCKRIASPDMGKDKGIGA